MNYNSPRTASEADGIVWETFRGDFHSLRSCKMMVRRSRKKKRNAGHHDDEEPYIFS